MIKSSGIKKWSEMTDAEVSAFKRKQCKKCAYFSNAKTKCMSTLTCDYSDIHKHIRGCSPLECVEKGIFTPIKRKIKK